MRTKVIRGFLLTLLAGETKASAVCLTFQLLRVTDRELIEALMTFPFRERRSLRHTIARQRKRSIDMTSMPPKSSGMATRPPLSQRVQSGTNSRQALRQRRLAGLGNMPADFNPFR